MFRFMLCVCLYACLSASVMIFSACNLPLRESEQPQTPLTHSQSGTAPVSTDLGNETIYYPSYGDLSGVASVTYSELYSVTVNGISIEVLRLENNISLKGAYSAPASDVKNAHIAMFGLNEDAEAEVKVTKLDSRVGNVTIRPLSYAISPEVVGNTVSFGFTGTNKYISVEIDGWIEPLFIFVDAPEQDAPNGSALGLRYFGPGVHELGFPYLLGTGDELYIAPGAIVNGSIEVSGPYVKIHGRGILCGTNWLRTGVDSDNSEDFQKSALIASSIDNLVYRI